MAGVFVLLVLLLMICAVAAAPRHANEYRRSHCITHADWIGLNSTGTGSSQSLHVLSHSYRDLIIFAPETYLIGVFIPVFSSSPKHNFSCDWMQMLECLSALSAAKIRVCDIPLITASWGSLYYKTFQSPLHLIWRPKIQNSDEYNTSIIITAINKANCKPTDFACSLHENNTKVNCSLQGHYCSGHVNCQVPNGTEKELYCLTDYERTASVSPEKTVNTTQTLQVTLSSVKAVNPNYAEKLTSPLQVTTPTSSVKTTLEPQSSSTQIPPTDDDLNLFTKTHKPWTYLLFGLFTCCSLLVLFGLLDCCRKGTQSSSSSGQHQGLVAALVIINGAQSEDGELRPRTPRTPGPPRYDDLDQPPSYEFLFPEPTEFTEEET